MRNTANRKWASWPARQFKIMKTPNCHQYRQGDVLIERIAQIPTNAEKQNKSACIFLAHGEVNGHYHALITVDPADWWKQEEAVAWTFGKEENNYAPEFQT